MFKTEADFHLGYGHGPRRPASCKSTSHTSYQHSWRVCDSCSRTHVGFDLHGCEEHGVCRSASARWPLAARDGDATSRKDPWIDRDGCHWKRSGETRKGDRHASDRLELSPEG